MSKTNWIVLLVGVNGVLLIGLLVSVYRPQQAWAQEMMGSGDYVLVSAEAELENEVLYLIDVADQRLHAFRSTFPLTNGPLRIGPMATRDLQRDFPQTRPTGRSPGMAPEPAMPSDLSDDQTPIPSDLPPGGRR